MLVSSVPLMDSFMLLPPPSSFFYPQESIRRYPLSHGIHLDLATYKKQSYLDGCYTALLGRSQSGCPHTILPD